MGIILREARLRRHLVVLDDDELIGAFVRQVAEEIGYQVTATTSPEVFLAAVSEHAPAAIILDLQLGGRDGVEVLRVLGGQSCAEGITLISGFDPKVISHAPDMAVAPGVTNGKAPAKP